MLAILFLILLLACVLVPLIGTDSRDDSSEPTHPEADWYPAKMRSY